MENVTKRFKKKKILHLQQKFTNKTYTNACTFTQLKLKAVALVVTKKIEKEKYRFFDLKNNVYFT